MIEPFKPIQPRPIQALKSKLAYFSLLILGYKPHKGADYTSRCPGCGYFAYEPNAGIDHYGHDCGHIAIPWYDPWLSVPSNLWHRLKRRFNRPIPP